MIAEKFHLGDVLSITTGCLLSPDGMSGIYRILNFMTGDNLYTHQLPRAADECAPYLLRQFPHLKGVTIPEFNGRDDWQVWLNEQVAKYGETLMVEPIPQDDHTRKDPVEELREMTDGKRVIVVEADEEGGSK